MKTLHDVYFRSHGCHKDKSHLGACRCSCGEYLQDNDLPHVYGDDAAGAKVRNLGDVKWHAIEDGSAGKGTGRHIACFILEPKQQVLPGIVEKEDEEAA